MFTYYILFIQKMKRNPKIRFVSLFKVVCLGIYNLPRKTHLL
jgi:hypothetical protein